MSVINISPQESLWLGLGVFLASRLLLAIICIRWKPSRVDWEHGFLDLCALRTRASWAVWLVILVAMSGIFLIVAVALPKPPTLQQLG
ncbi:hypothetical protein B0A48_12170 [Cryoendolithus antarcticus]|uniref:Uncharacterized protein n=1 Tax=Cryoendolithus antarcticus TaxID=1507870 RepID=A0A1V8SUU0_9PEZI|nr:hypothetical protein B0A48_12170 [Cryoendolithus antarcticus]